MSDVCVSLGATSFPERLSHIPTPPERLWIRGDASSLPGFTTPSIAVVGCRAASRDGLENARALADGLARAGVVVVSGLARGIDAAAHRAALAAGGCTVAVLGSGLGRLYPPEHVGLAEDIAGTGALVSEYPPHTVPQPHLFPRRNRLISGLADVVVVVEAPEKSGALITASAALDQGKDVMVVPGRVPGGPNRGGHLLIRDGAKLVETAVDILEDMGWLGRTPPDGAPARTAPELVEFTVDEVASETGEPTAVVLARLLELELAGQIQRIGCARFRRVRGRMLT
ncbi:MAG: DNA-processing protein DprA [Vicinamibacterales bacterium]